MKPIIFRDRLVFSKVDLTKDAEEVLRDALKQDSGHSLRFQSNATYSGYLLNNRVYPGVQMYEAVGTWCDRAHGGTAPFCKPVLLHHDDYADPVGRVIAASYTRLWDEGRWKNDYQNPATGDESGSGFIRLAADIVDPEAITKILDKRYLTLSTSFNTNAVTCSICGKERPKSRCDHYPGEFYEDEDGVKQQCYYIVSGRMRYSEVSIVNNPAQPKATIEIDKDQFKSDDCEESMLWGAESASTDLELALCDSAGSVIQVLPTKKDVDAVPDGKGSVRPKTSVSVVVPMQAAPAEPDSKDALKMNDLDFAMAHIAKGLMAYSMASDWEIKSLPVEERMFSDSLDTLPYEDALTLVARLDAAIEASALSVEQCKKLKSSDYCGPGRSFPVLDGAYVDAARRLIGRYRGSFSEKKRILENVEKAAVRFGAPTTTQDNKKNLETPMSTETKPTPETKPTVTPPVADSKEASEKTLKGLADTVADLQERNRALQADRDSKDADLTKSTSRVAELEKFVREERAKRLALMRAIVQRPGVKLDTADALSALENELAQRSPDSVNDAIKDELPAVLARLPGLNKGMPAIIADKSQQEPSTVTRKVDEPKKDTAPTDKDI